MYHLHVQEQQDHFKKSQYLLKYFSVINKVTNISNILNYQQISKEQTLKYTTTTTNKLSSYKDFSSAQM